MKLKIVLPLLLLLPINAYACDSAEEIIWNEDTLPLRDELPIDRYFKPFSSYWKKLTYQGGFNTACHGFIQCWKIVNDSLYLDNIKGCNDRTYVIDNKCLDSLKKLSIPQDIINKIGILKDIKYLNTDPMFDELKKLVPKSIIDKYSYEIYQAISKYLNDRNYLDFNKLVKKKYLKNNLFFYNYSGIISIGVGKPIDSMFIYWHNPTDKDLFFIIEKGVVVDTYYVNSVHHKTDVEGKELFLPGYTLLLPDNFVQSDSIHGCQSPILPLMKNPDTVITYIDTLSSTTIQISLNNKIHIGSQQELHVHQRNRLNSQMTILSNDFSFSRFNYLKLNYKGSFAYEANVAIIEMAFITENLTDNTFNNYFNSIIQSISCAWTKDKLRQF